MQGHFQEGPRQNLPTQACAYVRISGAPRIPDPRPQTPDPTPFVRQCMSEQPFELNQTGFWSKVITLNGTPGNMRSHNTRTLMLLRSPIPTLVTTSVQGTLYTIVTARCVSPHSSRHRCRNPGFTSGSLQGTPCASQYVSMSCLMMCACSVSIHPKSRDFRLLMVSTVHWNNS